MKRTPSSTLLAALAAGAFFTIAAPAIAQVPSVPDVLRSGAGGDHQPSFGLHLGAGVGSRGGVESSGLAGTVGISTAGRVQVVGRWSGTAALFEDDNSTWDLGALVAWMSGDSTGRRFRVAVGPSLVRSTRHAQPCGLISSCADVPTEALTQLGAAWQIDVLPVRVGSGALGVSGFGSFSSDVQLVGVTATIACLPF